MLPNKCCSGDMGLRLVAEHGSSHNSITALQTARPLRAAKTPKQEFQDRCRYGFYPLHQERARLSRSCLSCFLLSLFVFLKLTGKPSCETQAKAEDK